MPQTLLALLALSLGGYLLLQQSMQETRTERTLQESQVQEAAAEVALQRMAFYGSLAFDEATASGRTATTATALSGATAFGALAASGGAVAESITNDLDDYHLRALTVRQPVGQDTVAFRTSSTVRYAVESGADAVSTVPTRYKKVTVTVTPTGVSAPPVTVSQLFICGSRCTF